MASEAPTDSRDIALKMVEVGNALLERGDPNAAMTQFSQAIDLLEMVEHNAGVQMAGVLARAYNNRGIAYTRLDLFDEAADDFERAYALVPEDESFLRNVMRARAEKKQEQRQEGGGTAHDEWNDEEVPHSERTSPTSYYDPNRPICPKCQAPMALQLGPRGPFFSCLCPQARSGQEDVGPPETQFSGGQEGDFVDGITPSESAPAGSQEEEEMPPNVLALIYGIIGMTIVGTWGAVAAEYQVLGMGLPSAPMLGAIVGGLFGVGLAVTISCSEKRGAFSYLWSALVQGVILGTVEGALAGVVSTWAAGIWGAVFGFALAVLFGGMQLFVTRSFWRNANLSVYVLSGGVGIALLTLVSWIIVSDESPKLAGISAVVAMGTVFGAMFGAMMGVAIPCREPTWWTLLIGSVWGTLAGCISGTVLVGTGSLAIAGISGIAIGAFHFATYESIIRELNGRVA